MLTVAAHNIKKINKIIVNVFMALPISKQFSTNNSLYASVFTHHVLYNIPTAFPQTAPHVYQL